MTTIKKTFDDTHGRHALVYTNDGDKPAFGRVDVMHIVPWRMHPSRGREDYKPTHSRPDDQ